MRPSAASRGTHDRDRSSTRPSPAGASRRRGPARRRVDQDGVARAERRGVRRPGDARARPGRRRTAVVRRRRSRDGAAHAAIGLHRPDHPGRAQRLLRPAHPCDRGAAVSGVAHAPARRLRRGGRPGGAVSAHVPPAAGRRADRAPERRTQPPRRGQRDPDRDRRSFGAVGAQDRRPRARRQPQGGGPARRAPRGPPRTPAGRARRRQHDRVQRARSPERLPARDEGGGPRRPCHLGARDSG